MSTQTKTYDHGDTTDLKYSGSWTLNGNWSDSEGDVGTLSVTNDPNAYVSFVSTHLPYIVVYHPLMRMYTLFASRHFQVSSELLMSPTVATTWAWKLTQYLKFSAGHFIHIFWDAQVAWWAIRCMH